MGESLIYGLKVPLVVSWLASHIYSRTTVSHEDNFYSQKTYLIRYPSTQALLLRFAGCKAMTSWMFCNLHAGGEVGRVFAI